MAANGDAATGRVLVSSGGEFELGLTASAVDMFVLQTERHAIVCSSGDRETGEWRGIRVGDLLDRADPAADATHLMVTGADDYQVCVPLADTLEALLAVARLDAPDDGALPRFLGTGVGGTRSVKRVRRLETVSLAPGEDAAAYEDLQLEEDG